MNQSDPKFRALPNSQSGQPWCVQARWPDGNTEIVTGFETQYDALNWIREKSANWVVEKLMARPN